MRGFYRPFSVEVVAAPKVRNPMFYRFDVFRPQLFRRCSLPSMFAVLCPVRDWRPRAILQITMADFAIADVTDSMLDGVIAGFPNTYGAKVGKTSDVMYKSCRP